MDAHRVAFNTWQEKTEWLADFAAQLRKGDAS